MTASLLALGATAVAAMAVVQVRPVAPDNAARVLRAMPPSTGVTGGPGAAGDNGSGEWEPGAAPPPATGDATRPRVRALPRPPVLPAPPRGHGARNLLDAAPRAHAHAAADALRSQAARVEHRLAAHRRWGLPRLLPEAPPPPRRKVQVEGMGPVFRVPTTDRVIFLTADDGWEKDPAFLDLLRDLDVPVSAFLTDEAARSDYGYFHRLHRLGNGVHNHTVTHPELPRLSPREQRREICRQQQRLAREFGRGSGLFRPPYGAWDANTVRAARRCGVHTMVLWTLEAWPDRVELPAPGYRLRPGDIVLTHFRGPREWDGTMVDMARRVLRMAAEQGFAVARLEDYLPS